MAHYLLERYVSSAARASSEEDQAGVLVSRVLAEVGRLLLTLHLDEDEACFYLVEADSVEGFAGLHGVIDRITPVSLT